MIILDNEYSSNWKEYTLSKDKTIRDAAINLNKTGGQLILILGKQNNLVGTVTDGDIRRALLRGKDLDAPLNQVMNPNPFVLPENVADEDILKLMTLNGIYQIPVIDKNNHVRGVYKWDGAISHQQDALIVIMAGGLGKRLRPYTENCPKPMLEIAGKPIAQHIIEKAKKEGFSRFLFSIGYLGEMIKSYFGNGEKFGVEINYVSEDKPLGTAGALSLLSPRPENPFIVTNGDIISEVNYKSLLNFHEHHKGSLATMAVKLHEMQNPYGAVEMSGVEITGFCEKPITKVNVNAGVYVISPAALDFIKDNQRIDMPYLFEILREHCGPGTTLGYPIHEPWLDIGNDVDLMFVRKNMTKSSK